MRNSIILGTPALVPGLVLVPGTKYKLSVQVTGTSPTT
jgi:hypothetical protein